MITEEQFAEKVGNLADVRDAMTVEEFNSAILALASELTIVRNAKNRRRLAEIIDERQQRNMSMDEQDGIFYAHQNGLDCGRVFCVVCNPEVER